MPTIVYSDHFAMGFPGIGLLHPFDSYRARRAYVELAGHFGLPLPLQGRTEATGRGGVELRVPQGPVSDEQLAIVHTPQYLKKARRSWVIARAIEVLPFAVVPGSFLNWAFLTPMRWGVTGTLLAAREALRTGLAFSLTGGFHHAKPDRGEGFCLFNDIAYAIKTLHREGLVKTVLYIDLDAHQGNGVCAVFAHDPWVKLFDVYNGEIYPYNEESARARLDASHPIQPWTRDGAYLDLLRTHLPPFLDSYPEADLVVYNAGNDIVEGDRLGALAVSPEGVLARDLLVISEARKRKIPLAFLPSGGYTKNSYQLITRSIIAALS